MTTGLKLASLVNGRIIPAVAELKERWDRLYPAVKNARPCGALVCGRCGLRVAAGRIGDCEYQKRTLKRFRGGHPDADGPDEFVTVCPNCRAVESFMEADHEA